MMREARIVLPYDTMNAFLNNANAWLEEQLIDAFGGFTCTHGYGAWRDDGGTVSSEHINIYDVAVPSGQRSLSTLARLAWTVCNIARQDCVYLRYPDGEVTLIKPDLANEPREERNTGTTLDEPVILYQEAQLSP